MDKARGKRADCNQWVTIDVPIMFRAAETGFLTKPRFLTTDLFLTHYKNRRSANISVSISSRPAVTVTLVLCQADTQCGEGHLQPRWNLVALHRMALLSNHG